MVAVPRITSPMAGATPALPKRKKKMPMAGGAMAAPRLDRASRKPKMPTMGGMGASPMSSAAPGLAEPIAKPPVAATPPVSAKPPSDNDGDEMLKRGGKANWIKGAIKHPGALHEQLGVPEGEKIPEKKLDKAAHSDNPTLRRRANLAKTLKGLG